jgi:dephospho-CoA kinase
MLKIGITGGIGSGKSEVAKIIEAMGYPVFYSDQEAKNILNNSFEVRNQLIEHFGSDIYCNNSIDRNKLAQLVFNQPENLRIVNAIVHPEVRKYFKTWSDKQNISLVFNEAAILFETGAFQQLDKNILVIAPETVRIARVMERDQVSESEVLKRIKNQWTDEVKIPLANYILSNENQKPILIQVEKIIQDLLSA